ncbi:MAG TPA: phosphohydrolase, partial [Geobacter sp.]|nr:phosphohydrolase [Geobacter sp.]
MQDAQLYNSRIIDTFIKLIKNKYNFVNIGELLNYARMTPYEVADQGHWFTQEQVDLFYERLIKLTGNENIAREAGRYAASPEAMGVMRQYFLGLVGPAKAYEMIGDAVNSNFVRSAVYTSQKLASNRVEIKVTPRPGAQEKPYQCQNRMGFFEAIAAAFHSKLPRIEHPECVFRGDSTCRYIISWEKSSNSFWEYARNYTAIGLILITAICLKQNPQP